MPDPTTPIGLDSKGPEVKELHGILHALGFTVPLPEMTGMVFGAGTRSALLEFQEKYKVAATGVLDETTKAALRVHNNGVTGKYTVVGKIRFAYGLPASELTIRLYHYAIGKTPLLLRKGKTDKTNVDGLFALDYELPQTGPTYVPNIEVRAVYLEDSKEKEMALSAIKYNAARYEVMNLIAPASIRPPEPEYDRLVAALKPYLRNGNLAGLREDDKCKDLTLLSRSTGWDARLIALVSIATRLKSETGIEADVLYALFRVGLPLDKQRLVLSSPEVLEKALKKAAEASFVYLSRQRVAAAIDAFKRFAQKTRSMLKAPGALSSYGELLKISGLAADEQQAFQGIYFSHQGTSAELWHAVEKVIKGNAEARRKKLEKLRLQGKLSYLTDNNVSLIQWLQEQIKKPDNLAWLADQGFDRDGKWVECIKNMAGVEKKLEDLIPPTYIGEKTSDHLSAYASDMAHRVRLSYPLRVIKRKIEAEELVLGKDHDAIKEHVGDFLDKAEKLGFEPGRTPLGRFLKVNDKVLFTKAIPKRIEKKLLHETRKKLEHGSARVFFNRNWQKIFVGVKEKDQAKTALMKAFRQKNMRTMTLADFLEKKSRQTGFKKHIGVGMDRLRLNVSRLLQNEEKRMSKSIDRLFMSKVKDAVKTLVRLHQIAPRDEALQLLYSLGLRSAQGVTALSSEAFVERFTRQWQEEKLRNGVALSTKEVRELAQHVYQKAWLVHAASLNVLVAAKRLEDPSIYAISGPTTEQREERRVL